MSRFTLIIEEDTTLELSVPTNCLRRITSFLLACVMGVCGTLGVSVELRTKLPKDVKSEVLK